ncbi:MAG TPA: DUF2017 family protein [Chthoniobacterales bacterium]|nr:DUF2017 family protein [Chthoniobacterales bacterium]
MDICRRKDGLEISELDPFLAELLRQIPASTSIENSVEARDRIFSAPADLAEKELCKEWKTYVQPELQRLFRSATETVSADLEQLNGDEKPFANKTLFIPTKHADAWLNALNQARLSITARNGFTERDLSDNDRSPIGSRRDLSLFQVNFYGFVQEFILRELMECQENSSA